MYLGNGSTKQRAEDWFNANSTIAGVVVMSTFIIFKLVVLSLILQLLAFHIKLRWEGLSTYQFISRAGQPPTAGANKAGGESKAQADPRHQEGHGGGRHVLVFRPQNGGVLQDSCRLACSFPLRILDPSGQKAAVTTMQNGNGNAHQPPAGSSQHDVLGSEQVDLWWNDEEGTKSMSKPLICLYSKHFDIDSHISLH
jgi:hypothetical protein